MGRVGTGLDPSDRTADLVVIGGGLVGLATADAVLARRPGTSVVVLEKESTVSAHQSGRNSGVIHSGIYYRPGSAKARLSTRGRRLLLRFAAEHGIPVDECGKVIVAVESAEQPALAEIAGRGEANGVRARMIGRGELAEIEPHVAGVQALHVLDTGIIDYPAVARALVERIHRRGGSVRTGVEVIGGAETAAGVRVRTSEGDIEADAVVSCAGLHADRVARLFGGDVPPVEIVPFRGEYHALRPEAAHLCRNLIYPVPDPRFPFLGVHLTRHIDGRVLAGPNAVLALRREGYSWSAVSLADVAQIAGSAGVRRLAARHWRTALGEVHRSVSTRAFTRALQRMTPEITAADLEPHPAGVRAQAVHRDGTLAEDFIHHRTSRVLHVLNAPSPAATASLAIGEVIAGQIAGQRD